MLSPLKNQNSQHALYVWGWLCALLLSSSMARADWEPHFTSTGFSTSDHLELQNYDLSFDNYKTDLFWPYESEDEKGSGYRLNYKFIQFQNLVDKLEARSFMAHFITKINGNFNYQAGVGFLNWQSTVGKESASELFKLKTQFKVGQQAVVELEFKKDYLFEEVLLLNANFNQARATTVAPKILLQHSDHLRTNYSGSYSELAVGNGRSNSDIQFMYGVPSAEWLWLGPGLSYLSFRKQSPANYYSPGYVRAVGPRIDYSKAIFKDFTFNFGGSYNWTVEDSVSSKGYYFLTSLNYGTREGQNLVISFESIRSERQSSAWRSQGLNLGFSF